jgi:hypothetical protein
MFVYFKLFAAQTADVQIGAMGLVTDELETMWKEAVVA